MNLIQEMKKQMQEFSARKKVIKDKISYETARDEEANSRPYEPERILKAVLLSLQETGVITAVEYKDYLDTYNGQVMVDYDTGKVERVASLAGANTFDFIMAVFEEHPKAKLIGIGRISTVGDPTGIEVELYQANGGVFVPFREGGCRYYPDAKKELAKAVEVLKAKAEQDQKELDDFCEENKEYLELIDKIEKAKEFKAQRNNMTRKADNTALAYESGMEYLEKETERINKAVEEAGLQ